MVDDSESLSSRSDGLRTLRPEYIEKEHGLYVDWLNRALRKPDVRNIALSGPYGVGKSSILQGFRKDHPEAIFISLSTLGFRESKNHRSATGSSGKGAVSEETNRIQKEIVKQLLYREAPNELPASRFKRIHRMTRRSRIGASGLIGLAAAFVMVTLGVLAKIPATPLAGWSSWLDFLVRFAGVWLAAASVALAASPLLEGGVRLDKITAGPTTISLSQGNDTYFDEYLDEIMYFFEVRRKGKGAPEKTIVVFEDIDRFDNAEIFEELRELNTLLNNAGQLNRRSRRSGGARKAGELGEGVDPSPIVFIYAMKDSIFDASSPVNGEKVGDSPSPSSSSDKAALEAERANRTKFFDLIIPVVPFVTHQSARDLMRQELCGVNPGVSDELINRVARYVPELRVIRSVCNEYRVYARRLLRKGSLELEPDNLFAMMLYKAVHLRDYEDIRLGRSNLDTVYRTSLEAVEHRIDELNREYDNAEKKLTAGNEAVMRGDNFEELVRWELYRRLPRSQGLSSFSVKINGGDFNQEQTKQCEFWSAIIKMAEPYEMTVSVTSMENTSFSFELSKNALVPFVGEDAVTKSLESSSKDELEKEKEGIVADRERCRRARMAGLMKDSAVKVPGASKNDAKEGGAQGNEERCSFSGYVERALRSPLAAMLIRDGYIDENFILYTSVYHETSLTVNAMTFKVRHIEQGEMNATYELSDDEVKNLLSDVELKKLSKPGAYNIHILDYLLRSGDAVDQKRLGSVVEGLLRNDDDERKLLQYFFSTDARGEFFGGERKKSLVKELAPRHAAIFTVLIGLQGVDDGEQCDYVDTALQYASGDIDYDLSALESFIEDSFDKMKVFAGGAEEENRETVAELVKRSEVKLDDLSKVEEGLRELLIAGDCYAVNRPNLDAVAGAGGVSLDALAGERPGVYSYVLGALDDYLGVIGGDSDRKISAIAGASGASRVITDVASLDSNEHEEEPGSQTAVTVDGSQLPSLKKILEASNGEWTVDLRSVPNKMSWPILAHYKRFTASVENLLPYVEGLGMDESLAELLERQSSIEAQEQLSEADYIKLAGAVLGAGDRLTAEKRVELVASIGWDGFIPAETITPEKGELIGLLIKAHLIADDETSYELAKNLHDWPTKEFAIASSKRFPGSVDLVGDEVVKAIRSEKIGEEFKRYIIYHMNSSCTRLEEDQIGFAVDYAIEHEEFTLSAEALQWLPGQGVDPARVVALMARTLNDMKDDDVCAVVQALGEPYVELLVPGSGQIRISGQKGHEELLERLKKTGSVSSFSLDEETHEYRVHRKRK